MEAGSDLGPAFEELGKVAEELAGGLLEEAHWHVGVARAERLAFEKRLELRWELPLELLDMLLLYLTECGRWFEDEGRGADDDLPAAKCAALTGLGRRANRALGEVVTLLRAGFSDGAYARARTLHEIAVVSSALQRNDEEIAQRYCDHSDIDSSDAAEDLHRYREHLGNADQMSPEEIDALRERKAELEKKWGKSFSRPHGWMIPLLEPDARPSFRALERAAEMDAERPYYKLACLNVHADSRSLFSSLGLPPGESGALPGASDAGLLLPGVQSAESAATALESLLLLVSSPEAYLRCMVMWNLVGAVRDAFEEGEKGFQEGRLAQLQQEAEESLEHADDEQSHPGD